MKCLTRRLGLLAMTAATLSMTAAARADEITVQALDEYLKPVIEKFEAAHPGDKINLQVVSYQSVAESLPVQLASGGGPDISVVTDMGGLSKYYLDLRPYVDADYFEKQFGMVLNWMRGEGSDPKGIYGLPDSITVTGGFVNKTLFEQAGIALPGPQASWTDWGKAAQEVAKATNTDFPFEMDRSGHRFAAMAISYGAELVDEQGMPVIDDGLRNAIAQFVAWHRDGVMPMDLWGAVGGATMRDNFTDFVNGTTVLYYGGSWQLRRLDSEVGDFFDWKVIDAPCGVAACSSMPGGGALAGFKSTKHPELVGEFLNFASQDENLREMISAAVNIPTAQSMIQSGIEYPGVSDKVQEGLSTFIAQIPKMSETAYRFQGWPFERAMMNSLTTRISQVINNEMDIDTALQRIDQDVRLAIEAAKQ
ncbi:carbohydrate ABC transporter substrate-binding protein [Martelella alba]|uniref:Carbohydrate ABC transporter substrate-binding protein n=1 Tax=Martelella alba TaxID=2590451 RepID=A0A506U5Q7_9HYPH|nr:ABC transporter substrate-binding protein [Martelella alba]TPW28305.1 carbohydrate ABC transporter substrate-binding protein [Martelella alba]